MLAFRLFTTFATFSLSLAHPFHRHHPHEVTIISRHHSTKRNIAGPEFQVLADGNQAFRDKINSQAPTLLKTLTDDGQAPPFMFLGCSDSRVSDGTIFDTKPGTFFAERNIANQFLSTDPNTHAVLSYAVSVLGVKHVIVMGHYGCGGVAAAIASPPSAQIDAASGVVQAWIQPIREIFLTSSRPEIVELREKIKGLDAVEEPDISEPGFRALVEENVKSSVERIATGSIIANHYALLSSNTSVTNSTTPTKRSGEPITPGDVFIHGWVYDIANGEVRDLGVSVGPPGKEIPTAPFEAVANAASGSATNHGSTTATSSALSAPATIAALTEGGGEGVIRALCEESCKAKRFFA